MCVVENLARLGIADQFEFDSRSMPQKDFLNQVRLTGPWAHEVVAGDLRFRFGVAARWNLCFVQIVEAKPQAAGAWGEWVRSFASRSGFVQAWVSNVEFTYWQNAEEVAEYELRGRTTAGLRLISNGLPPPLEQTQIDVSANPGRRTLREGYVEAIGSTMWLTQLFWRRVGRAPNAAELASAGWKLTSSQNDVVEMRASAGPLEIGAPEDLNRLRTALYG
jgi:hypothetical protein